MVADRIIEEMQKGIIPWRKPWHGAKATGEDVAINYTTRKAYSLINQWLLGSVPGEVVEVESDELAEKVIADYVARTGLKFHNDAPSNRAFYSPGTDEVVVPMPSQYARVSEYYSTTFHELTHSTMKKDRCDRRGEGVGHFFGDENYSREELVAEMGSAMLCSRCGVDDAASQRNTVAYLQSWIKALKNDIKMIIWASARAEKAAEFIWGEN